MNPLMKQLEGKWYIISTNFPMWVKGDKLNPAFNYTFEEKGRDSYLLDEVSFLQNGKINVIRGFDYPKETADGFIWRGKGFLRLFSSHWSVDLMDKDGKWAVISFEKTLFTPAGADIISRTPLMDINTLQIIKANMHEHNKLKKNVVGLVELTRTDI